MEYKVKIYKNMPVGMYDARWIYGATQAEVTDYLTTTIGVQNTDWAYI